jgi:hypothetical protein
MIFKIARQALISTPWRFVVSLALCGLIAVAAWASLELAGLATAVAVVILGGLGLLCVGECWNRRDETASELDAHEREPRM